MSGKAPLADGPRETEVSLGATICRHDEGFLPAANWALHCRHVARQRTILECNVVALDGTLGAQLRYDNHHLVACRLASEP